MEWEQSFQLILGDAFVASKSMAESTAEKIQKQKNVKEEDRLFPIDIAVDVSTTAEKIIKPWIEKNISRINVSDIVVDNEFGGYLYGVRYQDQKYLLEVSGMDNAIEQFKKIVILKHINDIIFPKVERLGIGQGLEGMYDEDKDHIFIFYTYPGELRMPLDLNDRQLSLFMYIFHVLLRKNVYMPHFTVYTAGDNIWIQINDLFIEGEVEVYRYGNSLSYLQDKYYRLKKEPPDPTQEWMRDLYITQLTQYYEKMIPKTDMQKLFECFEKDILDNF